MDNNRVLYSFCPLLTGYHFYDAVCPQGICPGSKGLSARLTSESERQNLIESFERFNSLLFPFPHLTKTPTEDRKLCRVYNLTPFSQSKSWQWQITGKSWLLLSSKLHIAEINIQFFLLLPSNASIHSLKEPPKLLASWLEERRLLGAAFSSNLIIVIFTTFITRPAIHPLLLLLSENYYSWTRFSTFSHVAFRVTHSPGRPFFLSFPSVHPEQSGETPPYY